MGRTKSLLEDLFCDFSLDEIHQMQIMAGETDSHPDGCTEGAYCSDCNCECYLNHNVELAKKMIIMHIYEWH